EKNKAGTMPRTIAVESPGCPPIRAFTFDVLGLVKVIESRGKQGTPKVVDRWGEPDSSKCIVAASIDDCKFHPLLAVARKGGQIELLNPLNGDLHVAINAVDNPAMEPQEHPFVGLHLFKKLRMDSCRSCTLLTCTGKGQASIRTVEVSPADSASLASHKSWIVSAAGDISCYKVDGSENYALFGGKGVEVNIWDLDQCSKIWTAKPPPKNSLGIFSPTWFTSVTFLSKDDHRKFVAGTNNHQVRLYDISAQRRPVMSLDFRETPIKAVAEDEDGNTIYVGNGSGDLASFDIRTGKLLGCFIGKCSGSIRSIARHPELPVLASCGLDSYLRIWDVKSRQLLSAVFLKQHLTATVFDSNFTDEVNPPSNEEQDAIEIQRDEEAMVPVKRKKASKDSEGHKKQKAKKKSKKIKGHVAEEP
ncbi:hypothetical protein RJ641_009034, partial [Dillenia turbinata]